MRFIIDAQLPPALVDWLRERGHDAIHVADVGLLGASDEAIGAKAEAEDLILVTKDEDFVLLRHPDRFGLLWLRCGNATNRALAAWLDARWLQIEHALVSGERFVEAR